MKYSDKTVLVTGASSGIGETFARTLAAQGADLVLVARSQGKLEALAQQLVSQHGVRAEVLTSDLSMPCAALRLFQDVQKHGLVIDMLINNAGFATHGVFEQLSLERQSEEIQLNVVALVELTHCFLPGLLSRRGTVINVASTAAFQPVPYMAVYSATKAFVLSFSEALWAENRARGLKVLALCPGATQTPFFEVAGEDSALGKKDTPQNVVDTGLKALDRGQPYVISGTANYLQSNLARLMPHRVSASMVERLMRPGHAQPGGG